MGAHRKKRPIWNTRSRPQSAQDMPTLMAYPKHPTPIPNTYPSPIITKQQTPQNIRPPMQQVQFEAPNPRITIKTEMDTEEVTRLRAQLEIASSNEQYLRDELYVSITCRIKAGLLMSKLG